MNRPLGGLDELARAASTETDLFRSELRNANKSVEWVYSDPLSHLVADLVHQVAPTDASVLISGESGVGKELVARAVHHRSKRADGPLVMVNCASVPRELFESEFFGHVKGSFTGAVSDRAGRFERAHGGTLFLDEVTEIPPDLQSKLLRVLQEGQYERIGENHTRLVDTRIIASTNRDIHHEIKAGRFRSDLYYRLSVFPIDVPPLRHRPDDIPILAKHFLERACQRFRRGPIVLTEDNLEQLLTYDWPGNVRELQNVIERATITSQHGHLRLCVPGSEPARSSRPAPALKLRLQRRGEVLKYDQIRELELRNIVAALDLSRGRVAGPEGAAELLGMNASTLYSRIRALEIQRPGIDS